MSISSTPIQQVAAKSTAGGSATKTFTIAAPAAGNALRLMISSDSLITISGVTGGGVTWTQLAVVTNSSSSHRVWLFGGDNSSGAGTTISVTISDAYRTFECNISEWSGLDTTPVQDPAPSTNTGTSNTVTTSSVTPAAGKEVLLLAVGGEQINTVTNTPSGGFTALSRSGTATKQAFAYLVVASASGSYGTTWPAAVAYGTWATIIAGWDGASAASGQPAVKRMGGVKFASHGGYQDGTGMRQWRHQPSGLLLPYSGIVPPEVRLAV